LSTKTSMWMCVARPAYQPGEMVVKRATPLLSAGWMPRSQVDEDRLPYSE